MNYNLSILHYNEEINKKVDKFKELIQQILSPKYNKYDDMTQDTLRWKKSRIVSLMAALDKEFEDLNKYIVEGENEEDKKNNTLTNKIYSAIMPLMTYLWFSNQESNNIENYNDEEYNMLMSLD
jgi:hypothetical protein